MTSGLRGLRGLVKAGAELLLRIYLYPRPVVTACTGHALATAGALVTCWRPDLRVGARGQFKIGLNEVAIQLTLPVFGMELARDRWRRAGSPRRRRRRVCSIPRRRAKAGYLDLLADFAGGRANRCTGRGDAKLASAAAPGVSRERSGASVRRWSIACVRRSTRTRDAHTSARILPSPVRGKEPIKRGRASAASAPSAVSIRQYPVAVKAVGHAVWECGPAAIGSPAMSRASRT